MEKRNLTTGMTVTLRHGPQMMVLRNNCLGAAVLISESGFMLLDDFTSDLHDKDGDSEWDIIKVSVPDKPGQMVPDRWYAQRTLWERPKEDINKVVVGRVAGILEQFAADEDRSAGEIMAALRKWFNEEEK